MSGGRRPLPDVADGDDVHEEADGAGGADGALQLAPRALFCEALELILGVSKGETQPEPGGKRSTLLLRAILLVLVGMVVQEGTPWVDITVL